MPSANRQWFGYTTRERWKQTSGINNAWILTHQSIAKECTAESPYLTPNEWICGRLGQFLGLPIPPFALTRSGPTRKGMFASLRFGSSETPPDDTDPPSLVAAMPDLCAGIVAFDIWIANPDRHPKNIRVDHPTSPSEVNLFDHERALFGHYEAEGANRLTEHQDLLGIDYHCLKNELRDPNPLWGWCSRIKSVPKWFIEDSCTQVSQIVITKKETESAIEFLASRAQRLEDLILANKGDFRKMNWELF